MDRRARASEIQRPESPTETFTVPGSPSSPIAAAVHTSRVSRWSTTSQALLPERHPAASSPVGDDFAPPILPTNSMVASDLLTSWKLTSSLQGMSAYSSSQRHSTLNLYQSDNPGRTGAEEIAPPAVPTTEAGIFERDSPRYHGVPHKNGAWLADYTASSSHSHVEWSSKSSPEHGFRFSRGDGARGDDGIKASLSTGGDSNDSGIPAASTATMVRTVEITRASPLKPSSGTDVVQVTVNATAPTRSCATPGNNTTASGGFHTTPYRGSWFKDKQNSKASLLHTENQLTTAAATWTVRQGGTQNGCLLSLRPVSVEERIADTQLDDSVAFFGVCYRQSQRVQFRSLHQAHTDNGPSYPRRHGSCRV